jgi:hypothetical protein
VTSPVSVSACSEAVSNTTWNAVARLIPARSTFGKVFSFSFAVSRAAVALGVRWPAPQTGP